MEFYWCGGEVFLLTSGINIAQAIRENSLYALACRQNKEREKICFFISHKDEDTDAAIALGKHITEDFGFNIYLDVYDKELQEADKNNDSEGVVSAIHKGIQYASHLLCVVTEKSKDFWWIPYEIGFAQANGVKTSSIKIAFDGNDTTDPTRSDMKYYGLLQAWNKNKSNTLTFSDSHKKTYQVRDSSTIKTLQNRLLERMRSSKNMLIIISRDTSWDRGMLNFEIEKAVDYYEIPLIVAYVGYEYILAPTKLSELWPKALSERISNGTAKCIHIPFKEKAIMSAISQFSVHSTGDDILTSPYTIYTEQTYVDWGYKQK